MLGYLFEFGVEQHLLGIKILLIILKSVWDKWYRSAGHLGLRRSFTLLEAHAVVLLTIIGRYTGFGEVCPFRLISIME